MPQLVQSALAAALIFSALGAVIVCVLVMLFGFTGPEDEPPLRTARRLMYTRIGHALATTCFAATAILIAMVLLKSARAAPVADVRDARTPALGTRVDQQAARVTEIEARARDASAGLARAESRLRDLEQSLGRVVDEGQRTERRVGRLEQAETRAVAPRASTSRKSPPAAPPAATRTPEPASPPSRVRVAPPSPAPAPDRSSAVPPSSRDSLVAAPAPAALPAAVVAPAPSASVSSAEAPSTVMVTAPSTGTAPPPPAAAKDGEPSADGSAPSSMPNGLRAKLRQDWAAIQKGFESSRDDVRRAFDGTLRKLREIVQ